MTLFNESKLVTVDLTSHTKGNVYLLTIHFIYMMQCVTAIEQTKISVKQNKLKLMRKWLFPQPRTIMQGNMYEHYSTLHMSICVAIHNAYSLTCYKDMPVVTYKLTALVCDGVNLETIVYDGVAKNISLRLGTRNIMIGGQGTIV